MRLRSEPQLSSLLPLQTTGIVYPSVKEIVTHQKRSSSRPGLLPADGSSILVAGKVWLPPDADHLIMRAFIVAHCVVRRHRGVHVMINIIKLEFMVGRIQRKVQAFVKECLLGRHVKGQLIVQQNCLRTAVANKRNENLLMDYLYLGYSVSGAEYCLVLKDAISRFCELIASDTESAGIEADAIISWYKRFGLPISLMADNGTHFATKSLLL